MDKTGEQKCADSDTLTPFQYSAPGYYLVINGFGMSNCDYVTGHINKLRHIDF